MPPTAATALPAAQFAHMFEKYVDFLMTSIGVQEKGPPIHLPQTPSPRGVLWTKRTLAQGPDRENTHIYDQNRTFSVFRRESIAESASLSQGR